MSRERLLELVADERLGPGAALCVEAIRGGSVFHIGGEHEYPDQLVQIYRTRVAGAARRGIATLGGDDLVDRLSAERTLAVGIVNGRRHNFAVFFDGDLNRGVAVWAFPNDWNPDDA